MSDLKQLRELCRKYDLLIDIICTISSTELKISTIPDEQSKYKGYGQRLLILEYSIDNDDYLTRAIKEAICYVKENYEE